MASTSRQRTSNNTASDNSRPEDDRVRTFRRRHPSPHRLRPPEIRGGTLPALSRAQTGARGAREARPAAEAGTLADRGAPRAEPGRSKAEEAAALTPTRPFSALPS